MKAQYIFHHPPKSSQDSSFVQDHFHDPSYNVPDQYPPEYLPAEPIVSPPTQHSTVHPNEHSPDHSVQTVQTDHSVQTCSN